MADPSVADSKLGRRLAVAGGWLPVAALVVYFAFCPPRPCGLGGPGTCMFWHNGCDLSPGYVWLYSSVVALIMILVGRHKVHAQQETALGQRCAECDYVYQFTEPCEPGAVVVCWNCRFLVYAGVPDCPRCFAGLTAEGRGIDPLAFEREQTRLMAGIAASEAAAELAASALQCPNCGAERPVKG